jgi:hypothetical protein
MGWLLASDLQTETDFLALHPAEPWDRGEPPQLKARGYDNVLRGQAYQTPRGL